MHNLVDLHSKRIMVTGASSGIGRQTCITLSKLGAKVTLIARREEEILTTLSLMEGEGHCYYVCDLKEIASIEGMIKNAIAENGVFDGVVHCAGVSTNRPVSMYKYDKLHDTMLINFYAFFEIVRVVSKKGNFGEHMSIVGLSSVASIKGNAAQTAYAASKAAVDGAMRCLAKELHEKGIRVNTVMPAMIDTDMYRKYAERNDNAVVEANIIRRQYLGIGQTEDVANAIAFLLSEASKFITGIQLPVDGGFTSC